MLQVGDVLVNRYHLSRPLGKNSGRQTWLAIDQQANPPNSVVIKLLALSPDLQWEEAKLLEREARVLQRLDHPCIPKYRNYFLLDSHPRSRFAWFALVQSYLPGKSLQQLLEEGYHFSQLQVEAIALSLLTLLIYLHELEPPLLHRDIKPSNVLWGEDEQVYLVDFGAVQDQAALEGATFTVVGTYGYVPMEQFGGRAVPASDLYALGATLIHLLTGVAPADLPHNNARIQFGDRVSSDRGLVNWIGKLTEPAVTERFRTARQALDAFQHRQMLSPPLINRQPLGSRIQLQKSANSLTIHLPRRGGKALRIVYLTDAFISTFLSALSSVHVGEFPPLKAMALLILVFLIASFLLPAVQQTSVYLNRDDFEIWYQLFGFCYRRFRGKTTDIQMICEEPTAKIAAPKGISFVLSKQTVNTNPLATVERQWLIEEINDWLATVERQWLIEEINDWLGSKDS